MTGNPLINAGAAALYIAGIVTFIFYVLPQGPDPDTIVMPLTMLSLLVLSVSVMAYLFFYKPVTLYVEGKKEEAVKFFLHTIGYFAGFVALFFIIELALPLL